MSKARALPAVPLLADAGIKRNLFRAPKSQGQTAIALGAYEKPRRENTRKV
jgi:hypothetical protein